MKKEKVQNKLIEELERTPIISVACEKVDISRNTFYRWIQEDTKFLKQVNEAMDKGIGLVSDFAESNVLSGIKNKDAGYTKYWLSHRHPRYKRPFIHRYDQRDLLENENKHELLEAENYISEWKSKRFTKDYKTLLENAKKSAREMLDKWHKKKE